MVSLSNISKVYAGVEPVYALKNIDLNIKAGEFISIMGSSGSGKSTMLNILGILDNYNAGAYYLDDVLVKDLTEKQAAEYRNSLIGFVFQSFNLIKFKNAIENVALPLYYRGIKSKERNMLAKEYLEYVGLQDRMYNLPRELSGGQQQRVAIARALISKPKIILADEPTAALDGKATEKIMQLLSKINASGTTIILVTHERSVANKTRRIISLKDGEIETS